MFTKESKAGKILFLQKLQADGAHWESGIPFHTFYNSFMFLYFSFKKAYVYSEQQFVLSVVSLWQLHSAAFSWEHGISQWYYQRLGII